MCEQLTFTTLVGVDVRALDCGKVEDVDDCVPDSPVANLRWAALSGL